MPGWIMAPSGMFNLRSPVDRAVLKLARREPEMGGFLSGLYREAAKWEGKLPKGWTDESVKKFWNTMTGDVKHKVTKCMKEMDGKGLDTGAFCASLADKVEGTAWRHKKRQSSGMTEQEDNDLLEDLAGGSRRAFKMLDIWKSVQNLGTRYDRLMDPERYDPVRNFIIRAHRERFSDDAIRHYVENILGNRLPRDWKRIKAATTVDPAIKRAILEFVKHAQKTVDGQYTEGIVTPPILEVMWGKKYARIVRQETFGTGRSVFGFVDLENGDLLKAEGWKRPAKHARGNVLDKNTWKGSHSPWGMAYMRAASRVAARYMGALKVEPLRPYEGEKIKQAIEHHNREALDSTEMADDIEKAWGKWDFRTLSSFQVISRRDVQNLKTMEMPPTPEDEQYLGEVGATIKEHIQALRKEAWDHRKEAQAIENAWKKNDIRKLKQMRVLR